MTPSTTAQNLMTLAGRVLIAALFVPFGFGAITGFAGTVRYVSSANVPLPEVAAAIAIFVEFGLGLLLAVGYQARWAALGIAIFAFVISFIFHPFWDVPAAQLLAQKTNFLKNMAITGGLLYVVAFGPGAWSVDGWRGKA